MMTADLRVASLGLVLPYLSQGSRRRRYNGGAKHFPMFTDLPYRQLSFITISPYIYISLPPCINCKHHYLSYENSSNPLDLQAFG